MCDAWRSGGPPIEYAWQVTTSRATYLEDIKDVYKVFVHTTVMLINTKSMSTGERTNATHLFLCTR